MFLKLKNANLHQSKVTTNGDIYVTLRTRYGILLSLTWDCSNAVSE